MRRKQAIVVMNNTLKGFERQCQQFFRNYYSLSSLAFDPDGGLIGVFKSNTAETDHLADDRGIQYCKDQLRYRKINEDAIDRTTDFVYDDYKAYCEDHYCLPTDPLTLAETIKAKFPGAKTEPRGHMTYWSGLVLEQPYNEEGDFF